ncbi:MAG TPA: biotin/lipoyl-containing protein [Pyrinomonadaceae bacterium]|jgi:biotin carboxyl carrier protein|nr:biotin/lipoyl-containing protein [Pyrinomonadaceae bacterium]
MKILAEINNEKYEVEIKRDGANLSAEVGGRSYELEASVPEPNVYLLKHAGKVYQIFVSPNEKSGEPFAASVNNQNYEIKIFDPKRLRGTGAGSALNEGASEIKTAMPGKVVRVLAEVGAEIKQGEGVIIVEAMKMQNEMKSPKDGIVKEIRFAEGATVNAGDVLAVIE